MTLRAPMRLLALSLLYASACAGLHDRTPEPAANAHAAPDLPAPPSEYVVADARLGAGAVVVPLGPDTVGVVADGRRVVMGRGTPRVAGERPEEPLQGAVPIPERLGGGFLFWTTLELYRADVFDGRLVPVAGFPEDIASISFPPNGILVHARSGERWGLSPKGERIPIRPLGVVDVEALDDGRALTWSDDGVVRASTDGGEHWSDVTAQLGGPVDNIVQRSGQLWAMSGMSGGRVEHDGRLSWFVRPPLDDVALRPVDPRWPVADPPLRVAMYAGAPVDADTALVIVAGDVARVDLRTGAVRSIASASLPPEAHCEPVPSPDDVLFACHGNGNAASFVVAHAASSAPVIERTFAATHFATSDDGGLLAEVSCGSGATNAVCVRQPDGTWLERDLHGYAPDGGAAPRVARWIPRADGGAVAAILGDGNGLWDTATGTFTRLSEEATHAFAGQSAPYDVGHGRLSKTPLGITWVDRSFSFGPDGALRVWHHDGTTMLVRADGTVVKSPYTFDGISFAGALGLGYAGESKRLYQSTDHGASWTEIAPPPSGLEAMDLGGCSLAGCDVGAFYRIGWHVRPPLAGRETRTALASPPAVRVAPAPELTCQGSGPVVQRTLARTQDAPLDLGLGAERAPMSEGHTTYLHETVPRGIVSPVREPRHDASEMIPSERALFGGYATEGDDGKLKVAGPNTSLLALRRSVAYVAPFDPAARIVRTGFGTGDVLAAARRAGISGTDLLENDPTHLVNAIPLVGSDPAAPSDVVFHDPESGLLVVTRGERLRTFLRPPRENAVVVSAVALPGDELALLETTSQGASRVYKLGPNGASSELFDVSAGIEEAAAANPDALAIGPKGELAILRTPSGREPASDWDPAIVMVPGLPPAALAPWSELAFEGDPVCRADPGGFRAVLQLVGPWLHVTGLRDAEPTPMIARVRWTAHHACLEGFETRGPTMSLRLGGDAWDVGTWLVGRGAVHARVSVSEGVEWREPVACTLRR